MATIYDQPTRTAEEVAALSTAFVLLWDQAAASRKTYKITAAELAELMAAGGATVADGSITTAKLAASAVTYAKMQNVSATDKLLGRSTAGAGVVEEITCTATGRSLLAAADATAARTAIDAASNTNTVASLAALAVQIASLQPLDSDLTAIAALTTTSYGRSFLTQADATAGRSLLGLGTLATLSAVGTAQITDSNVTLAKLANSGAASVLLGRGAGSGAGVYQELTLGSGLSLSGTVLSASGGGGGTPGGSNTQIQYNNAGAFAGAADVTYTTGQLAVTPAWSGTGTATTPLLVNVTDPGGSANAASKLLDLQVGGSSILSVRKDNLLQIGGVNGTGFGLRSGVALTAYLGGTATVDFQSGSLTMRAPATIGWGAGDAASSPDLLLYRDAADRLALRRTTNAQRFSVYRTWTSSSNFERGVISWYDSASDDGTAGTVLRIGTEKGSLGGTARAVSIVTDGTERINVATNGNVNLTTGGSVLTAPNLVATGKMLLRTDATSNVGYFFGSADDTALVRTAANILGITNGSTGGGAIEFTEMTAPATPAANQARVFARDNGSGKTQVCIILPDGVVTVLATQT